MGLRCLIVDDSEEFLASASRLISTYERDDLADLIFDTPAVGFLPKAPSAPP